MTQQPFAPKIIEGLRFVSGKFPVASFELKERRRTTRLQNGIRPAKPGFLIQSRAFPETVNLWTWTFANL
jgi:hypothetical protein